MQQLEHDDMASDTIRTKEQTAAAGRKPPRDPRRRPRSSRKSGPRSSNEGLELPRDSHC